MSERKNSLKDQLGAWLETEKQAGEELPDVKQRARAERVRKEQARTEREPEAEHAAAEDEAALSDEDLFLRAVDGVDDGAQAILRKYDREDDPARKKKASKKQAKVDKAVSDRALFLQAVGEVGAAEDGDD